MADLNAHTIRCVCRACSILFDSREAGGAKYRLVPDRVRLLEDLQLDDASWNDFAIPVEMAFFFHGTDAGRVVAFYPGPMGATESLLPLEPWRDLERAHPKLSDMEPDVEALLIEKTTGTRRAWIVGVDVCYQLVGLIRTHWRGLAGGSEVWRRINEFFDDRERRKD
jgi:hypothetical protein